MVDARSPAQASIVVSAALASRGRVVDSHRNTEGRYTTQASAVAAVTMGVQAMVAMAAHLIEAEVTHLADTNRFDIN